MQIFKGRLIKVSRERRRFPNGYVGELEVIKHPGAALIVPCTARGEVVMIRQYRPVIRAYLWELPAGTLHGKEGVLPCARRELLEETGFTARKWEKLGSIYPAPGYTTERIHIYCAKGLQARAHAAEEDEVIAVKILARNVIVKLFKSGRIVDAKTICALSMAGILRGGAR